jgi:hypothetical protein
MLRGAADGAPLLDRVLFIVLLGILAARPMISESFERLELTFLPADISFGTTPATTVWLDALLLVTAALAWIARPHGRPRLNVPAIGLGLLLAGVVVSVAAANNKRLAANAGADLFVLALAGTALVRVMRRRWMVQLLIAAVLASGVTNAVKCITQRAYEFDESFEYWQEQKADLRERAVDVDSPAIVNYERRLQSREAFGYLSHPNVTAACLSIALLVGAGLLIGVLRKSGLDAGQRAAAAVVAGALPLLLAAGLWLTGSAGAATSTVVAALLLVLFAVARRWIVAHVGRAFTLLISGYVGVMGAGTAYGLAKGTLPHTSLAFRWQYWQAAARTLPDASLTGVGRENFRAAYLLHKPAESTEEVGNAHNVWLTLLVELGPLGFIAGLLLLGAAVYAALRACGRGGPGPPVRVGYARLGVVAGTVLLVQAVFSGERFSAAGIPLLWAVQTAGVWVLAFLAAYWLVSEVDEHASAAEWLVAGLAAALCVALIHNLIGFALFTAAGLSIFVTIAAGAAAYGAPTAPAAAAPEQPDPVWRRVGSIAFVGIIGLYVWAVLVPTVRMDATVRQVMAELRGASSYAALRDVLHGAVARLSVDRWDPGPPRNFAQIACELASPQELPKRLRLDLLDAAHSHVRLSAERDPAAHGTRHVRARMAETSAQTIGNPNLLELVAAAWNDAVSLYPTDPRTRIRAGRAWYRAWEADGAPGHAYQARDHLCAALAVDATRPPDVAAKLHPDELRIVYELLDGLRSAGYGACEPNAADRPPNAR